MKISSKNIFRKRKAIFFGLAIFLAFGVLISAIDRVLASSENDNPNLAADEKLVTIYDGGQEKSFITRAKTVREALDVANIEISENHRCRRAEFGRGNFVAKIQYQCSSRASDNRD